MLTLSVLAAAAALAADISGSWRATAEGPQGTLNRTFQFKQDGAALTGETESQMMGKSPLKDGKVDGDNVSFSIDVTFNGEAMTFKFTGKILSANEIKLTTVFPGGDGRTVEWQAKRGS